MKFSFDKLIVFYTMALLFWSSVLFILEPYCFHAYN